MWLAIYMMLKFKDRNDFFCFWLCHNDRIRKNMKSTKNITVNLLSEESEELIPLLSSDEEKEMNTENEY